MEPSVLAGSARLMAVRERPTGPHEAGGQSGGTSRPLVVFVLVVPVEPGHRASHQGARSMTAFRLMGSRHFTLGFFTPAGTLDPIVLPITAPG